MSKIDFKFYVWGLIFMPFVILMIVVNEENLNLEIAENFKILVGVICAFILLYLGFLKRKLKQKRFNIYKSYRQKELFRDSRKEAQTSFFKRLYTFLLISFLLIGMWLVFAGFIFWVAWDFLLIGLISMILSYKLLSRLYN